MKKLAEFIFYTFAFVIVGLAVGSVGTTYYNLKELDSVRNELQATIDKMDDLYMRVEKLEERVAHGS